jgi:hypothetical protein
MADEDLWHVRIAPDEVKILSLEKLDDLFRLDVIDGDVLVWQAGMDEWLPLRVVAGIGDEEDEEPEVVEIPVSEPPPRPIGSTTATAWPPQAIPNQTLNAWPPQSQPPPPSSRSMLEPPSARMAQVRLPPLSAPPSRPASVAPLPHPGRTGSVAPMAHPGRTGGSVAPLPHPGRTGSVAPLPHPGRTGSVAPLPHPGRTIPPAPVAAHSDSAWPPAAAWDDPQPSPFAATVSAAQFPLYEGNVQELPKPRAKIDTAILPRRRGGGTWVVVVALAAGAAVTLYRNAVVHAAAKSMGQEAAYLNLETALGGPSFGTPRAVEKMAESSRALLESIAATPAPTVAATSTPEPAPAPAPVAAAPKPEETPAAKPATTSTPEPAPARPAAGSGPTRPVSATRSPAASKEPAPIFKAPKKGKKGNEYDPLNPNL